TGDLALELARRVGPGGEVVACDFSERMLELARAKAADRPTVRFEWANALERGLSELVRVVRPGGHVVVLEMTTPTRPPLSTFFHVWFDRVVPTLGKLGGGGEAYTYLPNSVRRFPGPRELAATMERCGLRAIRYVLTAGGIIAIHVGEVA